MTKITTHTQLTELSSRISEWQKQRPLRGRFGRNYDYKEALKPWENLQDIEEIACAMQFACAEIERLREALESVLPVMEIEAELSHFTQGFDRTATQADKILALIKQALSTKEAE